jgi:alkanesulfonate monooxygenase SsuD/methylene tetrahydromethanopterin reductase-like flavin-dependent oxidoreductase (luciferase family)
MGSREHNLYHQLATRMGYGDAAQEIQDLYLAKRHRDAAAAVPLEFLDSTSLIGPPDRIAERLHAYAEAGVTTLSVALNVRDPAEGVRTLRLLAEALDKSGLGE